MRLMKGTIRKLSKRLKRAWQFGWFGGENTLGRLQLLRDIRKIKRRLGRSK